MHRNKIYLFTFILCFLIFQTACSQTKSNKIVPAAERFSEYQSILQGKNIAIVANQASLVNQHHLVDFLLSKKVSLIKIFSPEHGFRGNLDAGEKVKDGIDSKTNLPIISLYGKHKKPYPKDLSKVDLVVFDLQDVGVRFYTYLSTLHYMMEACAENNIPLLVLDRPNPNAHYINGPVLEEDCKSFVGLHPVPIVYGMTIGEYAKMINGEKWLKNGVQCDLKVITCANWTRNSVYKLPVKPSPNLPNYQSIQLYPSLCFFEGTVVSAGRGTDFPFQVYGHPLLKKGKFEFKPRSIAGVSKNPKFKGQICKGEDLRLIDIERLREQKELDLSFLLKAYSELNDQTQFFNLFFEKLAGTKQLRQQIIQGQSESEIKESWKKNLDEFKSIRKKYLIYPDLK
ncbi:exo-beta-N-acetylmuramidase NamZ domain-containing protein [Ancylomarina sp.]|uniref:exo-beta-N-acetylmuramidase NamZ family protein n=1 Tax=Ancylomarina sp. TaxID=1970196 RepID=UPI0035659A92